VGGTILELVGMIFDQITMLKTTGELSSIQLTKILVVRLSKRLAKVVDEESLRLVC